MADAVSHDQNFKNLIVDYPREALAFFTPEEAPLPDDEASIIPVRQEQLKERLGDRFRELDAPLLVEWADGRASIVFALEAESDARRFSLRRLARYCLDLADMFDTDRVVPVVVFLRAADRAPASLSLVSARRLYLGFDYVSCKLADLPAERWMDSDNLVSCHACSVASEFALRVNARRGPQGISGILARTTTRQWRAGRSPEGRAPRGLWRCCAPWQWTHHSLRGTRLATDPVGRAEAAEHA